MPIQSVTLKGARNARLTHAEMDANFTILQKLDRAFTTIFPSGGDDSDNINEVLAAGRAVRLAGDCTIFKPVLITQDNTGIDGNGFKLTMSTAAGAFDNNSFAGRYSVLNTGGNRYAVGIRADDIDGPFVRNCRISLLTWVDLLYLKAMYFEGCTNIDVSGNEVFEFSRGKGVICFNDCGVQTGNLKIPAGFIVNNYVHNIWTDANSGSAQERQLTAIDGDADCTNGTYGMVIGWNRLCAIGPTWTAMNGLATNQQTDAIQLAGLGTTKPSRHCQIVHNLISDVGEGIDCFGDDNIIANNTFDRIFSYAVKLKNGASRNIVEGNNISAVGYIGITIEGDNGGLIAVDCDRNQIRNNVIRNIGPAGNWFSGKSGTLMWDAAAAGAAAWAAQTQTGITLNFAAASAASDITNTVIEGNIIDGASTADVGIRLTNDAGNSAAGKHIIRDNQITGCAAEYSDLQNYAIFQSSRGLILLGTLTTTSGTTATVGSIPSYVRTLYIEFRNVSFNASDTLQLALSADGATFGTAVAVSAATGSGSGVVNGSCRVSALQISTQSAFAEPRTIANASSFTTVASASGGINGPYVSVRFSGVGGSTFDAGTITVWGECANT